MTKDRPRNMAASVAQRLMNKSKEQKEPYDLILIRFAMERLLYRLSQSPYRDKFLLKGAMMFQVWSGHAHRPTRDLDLLAYGQPTASDFELLFQEICDQPVEDDGLNFLADTVRAEQIKEGDEYQGLRIKLQARLASARMTVQVDIGFGDVVTPEPEWIDFPTLLDLPAPRLRVYPRETVVAEKYQAMVMLGIANSRMKDFYDL